MNAGKKLGAGSRLPARPNTALEATGHSVGFLVCVSLDGVARASAWAFGENSLWHVLHEYMEHYHHERYHQGKNNVVLFPTISQDTVRAGPLQCRERLGGLLKYYECEAA